MCACIMKLKQLNMSYVFGGLQDIQERFVLFLLLLRARPYNREDKDPPH